LNRLTALVRPLGAVVALAAGFALAGCETDGSGGMTRAMRPLSPELVSALEQKHMPKESPILVRIFKEESEMEVWKQDDTGRFALLKTYPICKWSGELGPKVKEGDRQAPEGYYTITPGQMNPNSNYYLSFNLGFPNTYDKANDRTGAFLMVHGDCSSAGCYAMTDDQMGEIYALGRESFFGGQRAFQVQAYPFRMTPLNLAKHRNSPNMAFWRMIKEGYDHFEVTRQEPKIDVCDKHYVFDAVAPGGSSAALNFNPKGRCPAYEIPEDVASAVKEKRDSDDREFANLVKAGTPMVASKTGTDGGMNPVFAAKLHPLEIFDTDGHVRTSTPPGTQPSDVNPPRTSEADQSAPVSKPADNPLDRMTSTVSKWVGLSTTETPAPAADTVPTTSTVTAPKPKPKPVQTAARTTPHGATTQPSQSTTAAPEAVKSDAGKQQVANNAQAQAPTQTTPALTSPDTNLIQGAQPVVPASSFDSRWGGMH
jgi:murein L,D-transpeptidase YafK